MEGNGRCWQHRKEGRGHKKHAGPCITASPHDVQLRQSGPVPGQGRSHGSALRQQRSRLCPRAGPWYSSPLQVAPWPHGLNAPRALRMAASKASRSESEHRVGRALPALREGDHVSYRRCTFTTLQLHVAAARWTRAGMREKASAVASAGTRPSAQQRGCVLWIRLCSHRSVRQAGRMWPGPGPG